MEEFRLLGPDDPPPVVELRPEGDSDFFLTGDHAGAAMPRRLGDLGLPESERRRHIALDIGIVGVTSFLSRELNATAILQNYSRLVIDCNRRPEWESSIPVVSELTRIPGNEAISSAEREARRSEIFAPYHDRISALLDVRAAAGRRTIVVAMHSFTPVFKGVSRSVEIGILYNPKARDIRLARIMLDLLRAEGDLVVGDNQPYAITGNSDYTVPVHAEERGLPHVEIEIRQDLIPHSGEQRRWAVRLARLLPWADERLKAES